MKTLHTIKKRCRYIWLTDDGIVQNRFEIVSNLPHLTSHLLICLHIMPVIHNLNVLFLNFEFNSYIYNTVHRKLCLPVRHYSSKLIASFTFEARLLRQHIFYTFQVDTDVTNPTVKYEIKKKLLYIEFVTNSICTWTIQCHLQCH